MLLCCHLIGCVIILGDDIEAGKFLQGVMEFCVFDNYRCFYILFQRKERRESPVVSQKVVLTDRVGIGGAFANTSGFVSNAVVGQAVDDRRRSFFQRFFFRRKP